MKRIPEFRCVAKYLVEESQVFISTAGAARDFWLNTIVRAPYYDKEKEIVVVLILNRKNRIIGWNLISIGSMVASLVHPREVMRAALVGGGTAFILMHSHPSGDPAPSRADNEITQIIKDSAKIIDISFQDHVIVGEKQFDLMDRGYYSFRESGII